MTIFQPIGQVKLTNVAVVRYKKCGTRFEVACYKNKILNFRAGIESDINEVLQCDQIFENVSKGKLSNQYDLQRIFEDSTNEQILHVILKEGSVQISEKERSAFCDKIRKEICSAIAEKVSNPHSGNSHTVAVIDRSLQQIGYGVNMDVPAKRQILDCVTKLEEKFPDYIVRNPFLLSLNIRLSADVNSNFDPDFNYTPLDISLQKMGDTFILHILHYLIIDCNIQHFVNIDEGIAVAITKICEKCAHITKHSKPLTKSNLKMLDASHTHAGDMNGLNAQSSNNRINSGVCFTSHSANSKNKVLCEERNVNDTNVESSEVYHSVSEKRTDIVDGDAFMTDRSDITNEVIFDDSCGEDENSTDICNDESFSSDKGGNDSIMSSCDSATGSDSSGSFSMFMNKKQDHFDILDERIMGKSAVEPKKKARKATRNKKYNDNYRDMHINTHNYETDAMLSSEKPGMDIDDAHFEDLTALNKNGSNFEHVKNKNSITIEFICCTKYYANVKQLLESIYKSHFHLTLKNSNAFRWLLGLSMEQRSKILYVRFSHDIPNFVNTISIRKPLGIVSSEEETVRETVRIQNYPSKSESVSVGRVTRYGVGNVHSQNVHKTFQRPVYNPEMKSHLY